MKYIKYLFVLLTLLCMLYLAWVLPDTFVRYYVQQQMSDATPSPRQDYRPDIRHCFNPEAPPLWECIRNES